MISDSLTMGCQGCEADANTHLAPHRPVKLVFPSRLKEIKVQVLCKPQKISPVPPFGPRTAPADWDDIRGSLEAALDFISNSSNVIASDLVLSAAYIQVADAMEKEIAFVTGTELATLGKRASKPRLITKSLCELGLRERSSWRSFAKEACWLFNKTKELAVLIRPTGAAGQSSSTDDLVSFVENTLQNLPQDALGIPAWAELWALWQATASAIVLDARAGISIPARNQAAVGILLERAEDHRDKELLADTRSATAKWKDWAKEALQGGASRAHKWSKLPEQWRPVQVSRKANFSSRPSAVLEGELERLEALWDSTDLPLEDWKWEGELTLGEINPAEVRGAARSFPCSSCSTWDGFHPRHFAMLTDSQLQVIVLLLYSIEARRAFPKELRALIAVLILKLKGNKASHRTLGIFPALYRLWARIKRRKLQAWELEHQLPFLAWQKGSSCVEVVYRQSLLAESHRAEGLITAAFLWDLSDFYEHINRAKLCKSATALGMPGLLVVIALNQYQGSRVVSLGQIALPARAATRGLPAGCTFCHFFCTGLYCWPLQCLPSCSS